MLLALCKNLILKLVRHRIEDFVISIFLNFLPLLLLFDHLFIQPPSKILHSDFQFLKQSGCLFTLDTRLLMLLTLVLYVLQHVAVVFLAYIKPDFIYNFKCHQIGFTLLIDCVPCVRKVIDEQRIKTCVLVVKQKQLPSQITKPDHLRQIIQQVALAQVWKLMTD